MRNAALIPYPASTCGSFIFLSGAKPTVYPFPALATTMPPRFRLLNSVGNQGVTTRLLDGCLLDPFVSGTIRLRMGFDLREKGISTVDPSSCSACGSCVRACPDRVLTLKDGKIETGAGLFPGCIACGRCVGVGAIWMTRHDARRESAAIIETGRLSSGFHPSVFSLCLSSLCSPRGARAIHATITPGPSPDCRGRGEEDGPSP